MSRSSTALRRTEPAKSDRLLRFRIPATLLALATGLTGGHLLVTGWVDPSDGGVHRLQDLHWGVAEGLLIAVALAMQLRSPARHPGPMRVVAFAVAAQLLVAVATLSPDPIAIVLVIVVAVLVIVHPARDEILKPTLTPSWPKLITAVPSAVALLAFAAVQVGHRYTAEPHDVLEAKTGWVGAAIATTALALLALTAAMLDGVAASRLTALGLVILGIASALHPHDPSSFGTIGGAAAIVLAIALAVLSVGHKTVGRVPGTNR